MGTSTEILKIVPSLQAIALAKRNLRLVEKKKTNSKDFTKQGMENIIGASIMKEQARFLEVD